MEENNELLYPLKHITKQEFGASFPSQVKFDMVNSGTELIMIRLPDVITYLSHAKAVNKYLTIKKLIKKLLELKVNELEFLWNELELLRLQKKLEF